MEAGVAVREKASQALLADTEWHLCEVGHSRDVQVKRVRNPVGNLKEQCLLLEVCVDWLMPGHQKALENVI